MTARKINGVTTGQEAFAREIVKGATQRVAYRTAYPQSAAWKDSSVDAQASKVLRKPAVSARVAELKEAVSAEVARLTAVSVARTLDEQARVAFFDPRSLLDANGHPLPMNQWPDHAAAAIASVDFIYLPQPTPDGSPADGPQRMLAYPEKIRFVPKMTALDQISRHLGMYKEDNVQRKEVDPWNQLPAESRAAIMGRLREIVGRDPDQPRLAGDTEPRGGERTTH